MYPERAARPSQGEEVKIQGADGIVLSVSAEAEAYDYILNQIRKGALLPGMRLKAEAIAAEIGVSRMPVREAFGRLHVMGVLTVRPNRGAIVTELSSGQIMELYQIRSVLEGLAIRLAAARTTSGALDELQDLLRLMERHESNPEKWLQLHGDFHSAIAGLSGAPRLAFEIEKVKLLLESYMRLWYIHVEKEVGMVADHQALIDALASRDGAQAEITMREHVLSTAPEIVAFLEERNG